MAITDVKRLSELASTALATYAYFLNENELAFRLTRPDSEQGVGMTESQANKFVSQYNILDIRPNDLTGFAATLFEDTTDGGKKVLALRGTEFTQAWGQIITDGVLADALGIGVAGFANFQAVQLYRYVKQLSTDGGQVVQYSDDDIVKIFMLANAAAIESLSIVIPTGSVHDIAQWVLQQSGFGNLHNDLNQDRGIGTGAALLQPGEKIDVTGHSLGGHLALLFARMFPQYTDQVVTLNAPTFYSDGDTFLTSIGFPPGSGNNITRLEADGDFVHKLGNVDPGYAISIAQEDFGISGAISDNHSSVNAVDGLNLLALFAQLDSSLINSPMQISDLIRKASNDYKNTYEKTLDFLRHFVLGENITETLVSTGSTDPNRASLYSNMNALINSTTFQAIAGRVTLTSSPTNISEIRDNFGAFLSLYHLSPFAIKANDITADNALKNANLSLKYQWEADADLTSEEIANGEANFGDMWIADRLAMLSWVNKRNNEDASVNKIFDGPDSLFWDEATQTEIQVGSFFVGGVDRRQFKFGDRNDNFIEGGNKNDRLYGMGGNDTIVGGLGDDVLDGGAGQDTLNGGSGRDILYGGADEDSLNGGAGHDLLMGGAGVDAYQFSGSYGIDIVNDSDGQGLIQVDLTSASGGVYKIDNIYKNAGSGFIYTQVNGGTTLIISKEGDSNRVIINNWSSDHNLGINLTGSASPTPQASGQMLGDFKKLVDNSGTKFVIENGNYVRDPEVGDEPDALDLITGTSGDDVIDGKGGSDALAGKAGNDYIMGGTGGDHILGGTGSDTLLGGDGDDQIYGSSDADLALPTDANHTPPINTYLHPQATGFNWTAGYTGTYGNGVPYGFSNAPRSGVPVDEGNTIDGGQGDDFIAAGSGADYVHGGSDNDFIWGMGKSDVIFGDGGNDLIYGDGDIVDDNSIVWAQASEHGNDIIDGGDGVDYIYGQGGNDILFGGEGDDYLYGDDPVYYTDLQGDDFLYGGAGNDQLAGGKGNDYLDGGDDNDTIFGEDGDDILIGGAGADKFIGGEGADTIYLNTKEGDEILGKRESVDTVIYDVKVSDIQNMEAEVDAAGDPTGNVKIGVDSSTANRVTTNATTNTSDLVSIGAILTSDKDFNHSFADGDILNSDLLGNNLNTELNFASEDLAIFGGKLNDNLVALGDGDSRLFGGQGDDILRGNTGNNVLQGGLGSDIYVFKTGGGVDRIVDNSNENNILAFGEGITNEQIKLRLGSFLIDLGNGDEIHIDNFDQNDVLNSSSIKSFKFFDGSEVSLADLVTRGFDIDGDASDNNLKGTNLTDRINGLDGNDVLIGGKGDDQLFGGEGDDTYVFNEGDGKDLIIDVADANKIVFGEGIDKDSLAFEQYRADDGYIYLKVSYGSEGDYVTLRNGMDIIEEFEFSDDTSYTLKELLGDIHLPLNISGTEDANTLFGSADDDVIDGMSGDDSLYGQTGNDELHGDSGNDQLYGEDGNDLLDGGQGNDILVGGSGVDTYTIGIAMGQDQAIEVPNAGEISILSLNIGLSVSDLEFISRSNDLEVRIIGTSDGFLIKDYYSSPTDWKLQDSLGATHNVADLANVTSVITDASELKSYYDKVVSADYKKFLIQNGYQLSSDGTFSKVVYESNDDGSYTSKTSTNLQFIEKSYWDNSEESIYSSSSGEYQESHTSTQKLIYQSNLIGVSGSRGVSQSGIFISNSAFQDGNSQSYSTVSDSGSIVKTSNGYWVYSPFWSTPVSSNYTAPLPKSIVHTDYSIDATRYLDAFTFANGDNLFRTSVSTMTTIDLGAGNDTFISTFDRTGSETDISNNVGNYYVLSDLTGADFYNGNQYVYDYLGLHQYYTLEDQKAWFELYSNDLTRFDNYFNNYLPNKSNSISGVYVNGNEGNDVISGSYNNDIIVGGDGDDYLDGGQGADHYYFFAEDSGIDTINDTAAITQPPRNFESFMNVYEAYFYGFKNRISDPNYKLEYERSSLPDMPVLNAMEYAQLTELYDHGVIAVDVVHFGPGITLTDLTLSWAERALKIEWGVNKGVKIDLPVGDYANVLGLGIEKFVFADGTEVGMGEMLARLEEPMPSTDPLTFYLGMAEKSNTGSWANKVIFDQNISSSDLRFSFVDSQLTIGHKNGVDKLILSSTFPDVSELDPDNIDWSSLHKVFSLIFSNGLSINVDELFLYEAFHTLNATLASNLEIENDFYHTVNGSSGADNIVIQDGSYDGLVINAGGGNDLVESTSSSSTNMFGEEGDDTIMSGSASDYLDGGEGNDQLSGGDGDDYLSGGAGNDILNGGNGDDTLEGGLGDDTYIINSIADAIYEMSSGGVDTVQAGISYVLGDDLENLTLTGTVAIDGTGNSLNNVLIGNGANNTLNGDAGNDTLDGGAGIDTLVGGDGDDTYIVDTTTDTITETATGGIDTVQSSVTFTLSASSNLENLILTGTTAINGAGNSLNNVLIGNGANNTLNGGNGNDTLDGGAGVDTLIGGNGDDTYIIDSTTDTITEYSTGGTDTVQSSVAYTLGAYLENLTITGTSNLSGFGNSLNNIITGNSGSNTLNGWGGIDALIGGAGNDVYIVDTATDIIIENANEGTDTVRSDVTYVLGNNIENLILTGTGGAINGTGNALSNAITGNAYANILDGGAGNDYLTGGDGNDTYIIDTTGDTIVETATGGIDTVKSSVTYTLGASSNLENLTLTGTSAINGTGNSLSNYLLGNSANNTLTDTAGGNDILQGLAGADTLTDTSGNNLLDGGVGTDTITAGSGSDVIIGGTSNDTITTGTGYDVILFNKGDGADAINASVGTDNTLSLGGNFAYSDLSLTKSSNDLILKMGTSDQITLKGWYDTSANNKSVLNLQVIAEAMQGFSLGGSDTLRNNKVETFNFANLVSAFDAAGATANWQLTDARLTAHLSAGSDAAAIGGDIAYQYGKAGSLTGVGLLAAQAVMNNASVGQSAQTLNASSSWAAETIKLS